MNVFIKLSSNISEICFDPEPAVQSESGFNYETQVEASATTRGTDPAETRQYETIRDSPAAKTTTASFSRQTRQYETIKYPPSANTTTASLSRQTRQCETIKYPPSATQQPVSPGKLDSMKPSNIHNQQPTQPQPVSPGKPDSMKPSNIHNQQPTQPQPVSSRRKACMKPSLTWFPLQDLTTPHPHKTWSPPTFIIP